MEENEKTAQAEKTPLEQATERAAQLSEELKAKVHPLVFINKANDQPVIGFIKEPNSMVKLAMLDKSVIGGYSASAEVLDVVLLKEHSDPRIYAESEVAKDDTFYLGAVSSVYDLVKMAVNQAKKKSI